MTKTKTGQAIFPNTLIRVIKFELYIPFRIQEDLVDLHAIKSRTKTENFRIYINYAYEGPVTYVIPKIDDDWEYDNPPSPSTAIQIIREYMKYKLKDTCIVFRYIGPSPFHADFYIDGCVIPNETDSLFECEKKTELGYDKIVFKYNILDFEWPQDAYEMLFDELDDELDIFYRIERSNIEQYQHWEKIEELMFQIIEQQETSWCRYPWKSYMRGRDLSSLYISLTKFESDLISNRHYIDQGYRFLYGKNSRCFLRYFVESAIKDRPIFPTKQVTDLMMFIENRRSKSIEFLIILIAAVVGGAAGSLITLLVK